MAPGWFNTLRGGTRADRRIGVREKAPPKRETKCLLVRVPPVPRHPVTPTRSFPSNARPRNQTAGHEHRSGYKCGYFKTGENLVAGLPAGEGAEYGDTDRATCLP